MSYRVKVWPTGVRTPGEKRHVREMYDGPELESIEVRGRTLADVVEGIRYRLKLDRTAWRGRDLWVQRGRDVWTFRPADKGKNGRPDRLEREAFI